MPHIVRPYTWLKNYFSNFFYNRNKYEKNFPIEKKCFLSLSYFYISLSYETKSIIEKIIWESQTIFGTKILIVLFTKPFGRFKHFLWRCRILTRKTVNFSKIATHCLHIVNWEVPTYAATYLLQSPLVFFQLFSRTY